MVCGDALATEERRADEDRVKLIHQAFDGDGTLNAWFLDEIIFHWKLVTDRLADRTAATLPHFRPLLEFCEPLIHPSRSDLNLPRYEIGWKPKPEPQQEPREFFTWCDSQYRSWCREGWRADHAWVMSKWGEARQHSPALDRFLDAVQKKLAGVYPIRESSYRWFGLKWDRIDGLQKSMEQMNLSPPEKKPRELFELFWASIRNASWGEGGVKVEEIESLGELLHPLNPSPWEKMAREELESMRELVLKMKALKLRAGDPKIEAYMERDRKDRRQFLADHLRPRYEPRFRRWIAEFMTDQGSEFWPVLSRAWERKDSLLFSLTELALLVFWDGMSWRFPEKQDHAWAVPIKNWRDDHAHKFLGIVTGEEISLGTFQKRRRALGLQPPKESGEPCLVSEFGAKLQIRLGRLTSECDAN